MEKPDKLEALVRELLIELGEDPDREGLRRTPVRVAKSLRFLSSGYHGNPRAIIENATFFQETDSMVIIKNIEIYSLCEHHLLPFFGRCHIGYIPGKALFGISKMARLVDMYARRLQIQERLTEQISRGIQEGVEASGVGVIIEAKHLCMMMRGVQKQNSVLTTSSVLGIFRTDSRTRQEFLSLIHRKED